MADRPQEPTKLDANVELETDYANNVLFEPSVWDLKMIFGEFSARTNAVDWHTSITLPWAQAKLAHFYLGLNIALHEFNRGLAAEVPIPMIPPEMPPVPEAEKNNPASQAMHDFAVAYRAKFLENLNKVPSV